MADRFDWFFKQKVTEAEMDGADQALEQADFDQFADAGLVGIISGLTVAENSPTPNLTVDVALGVGYDLQGKRVQVGANQDVNIAVDENSVSTQPGAGKIRVISIFLMFDRVLSDPRTDGNSATVFFSRAESFKLVVRQGADTTPASITESFLDANGPSDDATGIRLADIVRTDTATSILNADIYSFRRDDMFRLVASGSPTTFDMRAGTPESAITKVLQELADHLNDTAGSHAATAVSYAGGPAWLDGTTNPATTVEAQLDKIITDLSSIAGGLSGAAKIGYAAQGNISASNVEAALDELDAEKGGLSLTNTWIAPNVFDSVVDLNGTVTLDGSVTFNPPNPGSRPVFNNQRPKLTVRGLDFEPTGGSAPEVAQLSFFSASVTVGVSATNVHNMILATQIPDDDSFGLIEFGVVASEEASPTSLSDGATGLVTFRKSGAAAPTVAFTISADAGGLGIVWDVVEDAGNIVLRGARAAGAITVSSLLYLRTFKGVI